jgi:hypothetical protein
VLIVWPILQSWHCATSWNLHDGVGQVHNVDVVDVDVDVVVDDDVDDVDDDDVDDDDVDDVVVMLCSVGCLDSHIPLLSPSLYSPSCFFVVVGTIISLSAPTIISLSVPPSSKLSHLHPSGLKRKQQQQQQQRQQQHPQQQHQSFTKQHHPLIHLPTLPLQQQQQQQQTQQPQYQRRQQHRPKKPESAANIWIKTVVMYPNKTHTKNLKLNKESKWNKQTNKQARKQKGEKKKQSTEKISFLYQTKISWIAQHSIRLGPVVLRGHSRHEYVSIPSAWHERWEDIHDEDGLQNQCSLLVIGIGPVHHEIYGFKKWPRREHVFQIRIGVGLTDRVECFS